MRNRSMWKVNIYNFQIAFFEQLSVKWLQLFDLAFNCIFIYATSERHKTVGRLLCFRVLMSEQQIAQKKPHWSLQVAPNDDIDFWSGDGITFCVKTFYRNINYCLWKFIPDSPRLLLRDFTVRLIIATNLKCTQTFDDSTNIRVTETMMM